MQIFILSKQNGKGFTNCTNLKDLKTELYNLVAANNASYEHYNFDVTNLTSKSSGDFLSLELSFAAYPDVLRKIANHSLNLYVIYKEQVVTNSPVWLVKLVVEVSPEQASTAVTAIGPGTSSKH